MKSMDREISLATGIFAGISVQQENYNLIIKGNYEGIYLKKKTRCGNFLQNSMEY